MGTTLHTLKGPKGASRNRIRVGRGHGSGRGETAGKGTKGQKARAGHHGARRGFEGGQMPLQRRLPKRGFTNIFKKRFAVVNLRDLAKLDPAEAVTPELLLKRGLIKRLDDGLKVLGEGELKASFTIQAHHFSKSALDKIQKAGGKAEVLPA